ncbi:MAG TPA: sterol desaturase family protein, partial [Flavihumibacter sp.]|nr:sterol desaturase family protein [Flavihumibacter sp.]
MKFEKIHNKGQARLFENPVLEFFTKSNPLVIWGIYIPYLSFLIYHSIAHLGLVGWKAALIFAGGFIFWSFFEYLMHRFAFHFESDTPRVRRFIYLMHGNHHEYPRDRERLFMPPVPSLVISSIILGIMYGVTWIFSITPTAFPFFAGFMIGYLSYASMHYAIHTWKPPFKWMKPLW